MVAHSDMRYAGDVESEVGSDSGAKKSGETTSTSADPIEPASTEPSDETPPRLATLQIRDPKRYDILGEHGRGGLGRVLRARDKELDRDVAVKELLERGTVDELRFLREALITARLEHPGIVPVHEAGRWPDGTPFYAMKLVAGSPLKGRIEAAADLSERLALIPNVIAVADAIAYAHSRQIIHRDLKPSNVIVGEFGETVVIDWGLAKALDDTKTEPEISRRNVQTADLTSMGSAVGTPAYMAPEQRDGIADERSDVYALGGILFHVLTCHAPHAETRQTSLDNAFQRDAPRDLVAIALRALSLEPARRYVTAAAFADDLRRFRQGQPVTARRYSIAERLGRAFSRHRAVAISALVALVVVIAILVGALVRVDGERDDAVTARGEADMARTAEETARKSAETAKDALVLQHAELLLHSDPTEALASLAGYHGPQLLRRKMIEAEARGRGVAQILTEVGPNIDFMVGQADGSVISINQNGRVQLHAHGSTTDIARDGALFSQAIYAAPQHLLVYGDLHEHTVAFDLTTGHRAVLETGRGESRALAPGGSKFAVVTQRDVQIWSIATEPTLMNRQPIGGDEVGFADDAHVVVSTDTKLTEVELPSGVSTVVAIEPESVHDVGSGLVAIGDRRGKVTLVAAPGMRVVGTVTACGGEVRGILVVPTPRAVVAACRDGAVRRIDARTLAIRDLFHMLTSVRRMTRSSDDALVLAIGETNTLYVYDMVHGTTAHYTGPARPWTLTAPSNVFPDLLSSDDLGVLRRWRRPSSDARGFAMTDAGIFSAQLLPDKQQLVASGLDGTLRIANLRDGSIRTVEAVSGGADLLRPSPDGRCLLVTNFSDTARVFDTRTWKVLRTFMEHHGRVSDAKLLDCDHIVSAGRDGRVLRWSAHSSSVEVLFAWKYPLYSVQLAAGSYVADDSAGNIFHLRADGIVAPIRVANGEDVYFDEVDPTGRVLGVPVSSGRITAINLQTYVTTELAPPRAGAKIVWINHDTTRAIIGVPEGALDLPLGSSRDDPWKVVKIALTRVAFSPLGDYIALGVQGGSIWLYSRGRGAWRYINDHELGSIANVLFTHDGHLLSWNTQGDVFIRDVEAMFAQQP